MRCRVHPPRTHTHIHLALSAAVCCRLPHAAAASRARADGYALPATSTSIRELGARLKKEAALVEAAAA